jgi:hypothetical protein
MKPLQHTLTQHTLNIFTPKMFFKLFNLLKINNLSKWTLLMYIRL